MGESNVGEDEVEQRRGGLEHKRVDRQSTGGERVEQRPRGQRAESQVAVERATLQLSEKKGQVTGERESGVEQSGSQEQQPVEAYQSERIDPRLGDDGLQ